jgi:hypothetical protein
MGMITTTTTTKRKKVRAGRITMDKVARRRPV